MFFPNVYAQDGVEDFQGTYRGTTQLKINGRTRTLPISVKITRTGRLTGQLQVFGLSRLVTARGRVDESGNITGTLVSPVARGSFSGTIRNDRITAAGTITGLGGGSRRFTAVANKVSDDTSEFKGSYRALGLPNQPYPEILIHVARSGVATIEFRPPLGPIVIDNAVVGSDGIFNSVKNGLYYFVEIRQNGSFEGTYRQNGLTYSFNGTKTSSGGVRKSPAGSYLAISNDPNQAAFRLSFKINKNLAVSGKFSFRDGSSIPFTALVGPMDKIVGNTEGGISYFITVGTDGQFVATYSSLLYGSGSFAGDLR